jgi:hypothetical protein
VHANARWQLRLRTLKAQIWRRQQRHDADAVISECT